MVFTQVRYDTPGYEGETRRQFNARFDHLSPDVPEYPEAAQYLLDWFADMRDCADHDKPLTPTHMRDWQAVTGNVMTREEMAIIRQMDSSWRASMADEQSRYMAAVQEANRQSG